MEIIGIMTVIGVLVGFSWLLLKPTLRPKSKAEKQAQIKASYVLFLDQKLSPYKEEREKLKEEKAKILKRFAKELRHNLFFDEEEVRALLRELAYFEPN
ncbi:MAG: hypothetical protein IBX45_09170 [Campylobacterales bacterium]|nr:hypothetical protein [Campylobacterales bacterium]